jgi:hypothetical protein
MNEKEILFYILEHLGFNKVLPREHGWTEENFSECCFIFDGKLWIIFGGKNEHYIDSNNLDVSESKVHWKDNFMHFTPYINGDLLTVPEFLKFWNKFYIGHVMDNVHVNVSIRI